MQPKVRLFAHILLIEKGSVQANWHGGGGVVSEEVILMAMEEAGGRKEMAMEPGERSSGYPDVGALSQQKNTLNHLIDEGEGLFIQVKVVVE